MSNSTTDLPWTKMGQVPLGTECLVDTTELTDRIAKLTELNTQLTANLLQQEKESKQDKALLVEKVASIDQLKKISAATFGEMENKLLALEKNNENKYTEVNFQILLFFIVGKRLGLKGEELDQRVIGSILLFLQQRKKVYEYLRNLNRPELSEPLKPVLLITESTLKTLIDRNRI